MYFVHEMKKNANTAGSILLKKLLGQLVNRYIQTQDLNEFSKEQSF